jgi:uncharacterized membrane protein
MKKIERNIWKMCYFLAIGIVVISFTPLVLAPEKIYPYVMGMPYNLGVSMLLSFVLVLLTIVGTFVHPGKFDED